jgi:diguanylate cyclase (GGDEF)-like protein
VREVDTIARFGGDEFVLMLGELDADPQRAKVQAEQVAQKVLSALARPYVVLVQRHDQPDATVEHRCSASIGLVMFNGYERGPQEILQHADAAMYLAKQAGRNQIRFSTGPASGP